MCCEPRPGEGDHAPAHDAGQVAPPSTEAPPPASSESGPPAGQLFGTVADVLAGRARSVAVLGDCLDVLRSLPVDCVDLVFGSPSYEDARLYDELNFQLRGQAWVDWM